MLDAEVREKLGALSAHWTKEAKHDAGVRELAPDAEVLGGQDKEGATKSRSCLMPRFTRRCSMRPRRPGRGGGSEVQVVLDAEVREPEVRELVPDAEVLGALDAGGADEVQAELEAEARLDAEDEAECP